MRVYFDNRNRFKRIRELQLQKEREKEKKAIEKIKIPTFQVYTDKTKEEEEGELSIKKLKTSKDRIKQPKLSESKTIPRLGTSSVLNGTTGQGKSTLLANLISDRRFYGNGKAFDFKFLISPTAEGDDVQKELGILEHCTLTDLERAPEVLKEIMSLQKKSIKAKGNDKAPQVCLLYDDVISDQKFMRTNEFIKSFIASRHYNCTTFVCSQSWTIVPRVCRLQASNIFFFAAPLSEVELLYQEYCPPKFNKRQFYAMVDYATRDDYSFLYINKSSPMKERFRKNLDEIIDLESFARETAHLNNFTEPSGDKSSQKRKYGEIDSDPTSEYGQDQKDDARRGKKARFISGSKNGSDFASNTES